MRYSCGKEFTAPWIYGTRLLYLVHTCYHLFDTSQSIDIYEASYHKNLEFLGGKNIFVAYLVGANWHPCPGPGPCPFGGQEHDPH